MKEQGWENWDDQWMELRTIEAEKIIWGVNCGFEIKSS